MTETGLVLCKCGCGSPAPIATRTDVKQGYMNGKPRTFIHGHNGKKHGFAGNYGRGEKRKPEYSAYAMAKSRCQSPTNPKYSSYGGRGIEFRFTSFPEFLREIGLKPSPQHSLDRKNNEGHYESGNVRWATRRQQYENRRYANQFRTAFYPAWTRPAI